MSGFARNWRTSDGRDVAGNASGSPKRIHKREHLRSLIVAVLDSDMRVSEVGTHVVHAQQSVVDCWTRGHADAVAWWPTK